MGQAVKALAVMYRKCREKYLERLTCKDVAMKGHGPCEANVPLLT